MTPTDEDDADRRRLGALVEAHEQAGDSAGIAPVGHIEGRLTSRLNLYGEYDPYRNHG